jgi:N-methylhydantoinase A/oxoprolinase/acetone carboxylase beta subunit
MIDGGHEFDGTPIRPLDERAFAVACAAMNAAGLESLAACSPFSFVNPVSEDWIAAEAQRLPFVRHVSLSHDLGGVGLYQRENATVLNAALRPLASQAVAAYIAALERLGLKARLYISQNDGTLMDAAYAARFPVLTISSGPTNSMRGAAHLSGLSDAMVVDVGGTTSDVGMLAHGIPRRSSGEVTVGGVATNFRMPDVLSIGLGGGSHVSPDGKVIGPRSVGHELRRRARCFAGDVLTATDIAVVRGLVDLGAEARRVDLDPAVVKNAEAAMLSAFIDTVERMKVTPVDLPLIAVGGAAFLIPDALPGISKVVRPQHAAVANAVGAAMGKVGAEFEIVFSRGKDNRESVIHQARDLATDRAVSAGAARASVEITDIDEVPISYLEDPLVRLRVKAAGEMQL